MWFDWCVKVGYKSNYCINPMASPFLRINSHEICCYLLDSNLLIIDANKIV